MKRLIPLCVPLLLCLPLLGRADEEAPKILADQIYGRKDGMALTLDVIKPAKPNGAGILWLQSGGWYSTWNEPKFLAAASKPYLDKGFTMLIVRHGSAPKYTVPEAVADVRRSVRFIRMKAKDFGVDPERLGVMGGSAGGHLSLMLGTTGDDGNKDAKDEVLKHSSRVAAVVALYPPTVVKNWDNQSEEIKKHAGLKPPLMFDEKLTPQISPRLKATDKAAPTLLIHGDKDELVPIEHSTKMIEVLEKVKVPCKLVTIEGAAHGFNKEQNEKTVGPEMLGWFEKHLAKKKEVTSGSIGVPFAMHDEERGLLDAVAAHPDGDHDRRVYADWLEDHGESARAEFVRIQVAIARLAEDHPDRTALLTRERGLLLEYEESWTLGLRQLLKEWTWRRGFVDEVAVHDPPRPLTAARFDELLAWPFVRKITARQGWRLFPGLIESEGAQRLEALRVESSAIESRHFRSLLSCPRLERLESLELIGCGLTDADARRLAASPLLRRLHTLDMSGNNLTDTGVIALARSPHVAGLKRLALSVCGATGDSALALASAPLLNGLGSLDLSANALGNDVAALFHCPHLRELTELDLSVTEADPEVWSTLFNRQRPLINLRLRENGLRRSQVFDLLSSPRLASLRRLDLGEAHILDDGSSWTGPSETPTTPLDLDLSGIASDAPFREELFFHVPALRHSRRLAVPAIANSMVSFNLLLASPNLVNLRHLDVSRSYGLIRDSLNRLLHSELAKILTGLDLSSCELGDSEISDLANKHPHLANLSWLSLRNNHVGSRGARALAESPYLGNLRHLDLSENHLDDEAATHLAGADHLASPVVLNVAGNPIGAAGTAALFGAARRAFSRGVTIPHLDA